MARSKTQLSVVKPLEPSRRDNQTVPFAKEEQAARIVARQLGRQLSQTGLFERDEPVRVYTRGLSCTLDVDLPIGCRVRGEVAERGVFLGGTEEGAVVETEDGRIVCEEWNELRPDTGECLDWQEAEWKVDQGFNRLDNLIAAWKWAETAQAKDTEAGRAYVSEIEAEIRHLCAGLWPQQPAK